MINNNSALRPKGFIFPVLVFTMSAVMIATLSMMAILVIKIKAYSGSSMCGMRAYYAAQSGLNELAKSGQLTAYAGACGEGQYALTNGSCALPGATGTVTAIDSECSYSVQVATATAGLMQVNAIGRCNQGTDCGGGNGAVIKISTQLSYPLAAYSPCPGMESVSVDAETYDTAWFDDGDSTLETGECWMKQNLRNAFNAATDRPTADGNAQYMGRLYTYAGVERCPNGWHVPTQTEWDAMLATLTTAGTKLKPASSGGNYFWDPTGYRGDGSTGFNMPGAGYYSSGYQNFGTIVYYWSSTDDGGIPGNKVVYSTTPGSDVVVRGSMPVADFLSARCVNN